MPHIRSILTLPLVMALALPTAGDARARRPAQPAQPRTVQPFSNAERQQGAEAHQQIMREFGDAYTGAQAAYVRNVGQNIAVQSGLSSARADFTVTLLNSPVNNAFALPGGYIYTTRQLLALMNNEAELAGVLGHEVGHTAARHARQRESRSRRNAILGVLATVLGGAIGDNGGLLGGLGGFLQNNAMQAAQMATLSFSRSQETEADDLGIRYLAGAGYDPAALSTVLASLAAQNALDVQASGQSARAIPEWASTHPDPASRVRRALTVAQTFHVASPRTNRDGFMTAVNGVLYGDDPHQGVVEGRNFLHPDLRLGFTVPGGYGMQNGTAQVAISGQGGQAIFTTLAYSGDKGDYLRRAFASIAGENTRIQPSEMRETSVNGIPAFYATARVNSGQQMVDLTIFAYAFSANQAFHFAAIAPAGRTNQWDAMFGSVRRLSASEAAAIRPRRISVVSVRRGDTIASLSGRMAYDNLREERFRVLNALAAGSALTVGQRVKVVTYAN